MKHLLLIVLSLTFGLTTSFADESTSSIEDDAPVAVEKKQVWRNAIQEKYSLTDEQMKSLGDAGFNETQMAKVNQLALKSENPLDEVMKMRTEQKMGWGKIAKELNVHPSEIGKSVSSLRHKVNERRYEKKSEKRALKRSVRAERRAVKAERRMNRQRSRKQNRKK